MFHYYSAVYSQINIHIPIKIHPFVFIWFLNTPTNSIGKDGGPFIFPVGISISRWHYGLCYQISGAICHFSFEGATCLKSLVSSLCHDCFNFGNDKVSLLMKYLFLPC